MNGTKSMRLALLATVAAWVGLEGSAALAQSAGIEEIIVTARKRAESLQSIPVAVTAFSAEALSVRGIRDLTDVALLTPGLSFESFTGGGFGTPTIRGATQQSITGLENNVSVFLDGIYVPRAYAINLGTESLERIEVVKGPQGSLYGQNAFMGAINYITEKPSDEIIARGKVSVGSDKLYEASASLGAPIVADKLSALVNGSYSKFDGTWKNNHPLADADIPGGNTKGNLGGWDNKVAGLRALFTPTEDVTIDASYRYFEIKNEASPRFNFQGVDSQSSPRSVSTVRNNCARIDPVFGFGLYCGALPIADPATYAADPRQTGTYTKTNFLSVNAGWNISPSLSLQYSFGELRTNALQISAQNDSNLLIPGRTMAFQATPNGSFNYSSHELRAEYEASDSIQVSVGGFSSRNKDINTFLLGVGIPVLVTTPVTLANLPVVQQNTNTKVETEAIFGAFTIKFLEDRARLSIEGRHTWEELGVNNLATRTFRGRKSSFSNPRFTFDYNLTDQSLLYASAASGTKAGGVNADPAAYAPFGGLLPNERSFEPDKNWTYEIGSKNTLWDNRLELNATAFYIDWTGMQINSLSTPPPGVVFPPTVLRAPTIILNLGDATIKGVEIEGVAQPIEPLTLTFGGSYQDAEYSRGVPGTRTLDVCDGIVCRADIGGNTLQRSPSTKFSAGFNWQQPLEMGGSDMAYFIQGDLAWQNKQYTDETNTSWVPSRTILNLSVGLEAEHWTMKLWAKNALDKKYVSSAIFGPFRSSFYTPIFGAQGTYGLTLSAKY